MMTIVFTILMFLIFGKIIWFAFRAACGLTKIFFSVILLPVVLIGLVIGGFIYLALPILVIVGVITLIAGIGK